MADKQKVSDYLAECKTFYVATVNDGAPTVRPIGFQMCHDGELYFGIGTHKAVFAQIQAFKEQLPRPRDCGAFLRHLYATPQITSNLFND